MTTSTMWVVSLYSPEKMKAVTVEQAGTEEEVWKWARQFTPLGIEVIWVKTYQEYMSWEGTG